MENSGKFSEWVENVVGIWEKEKSLIMSNFSFSHRVFKRLVLQTRINQGLLGKELMFLLLCFYFQFYSSDTGGLPVAVQCIALPFQEELVLRVMKELEIGLKRTK